MDSIVCPQTQAISQPANEEAAAAPTPEAPITQDGRIVAVEQHG